MYNGPILTRQATVTQPVLAAEAHGGLAAVIAGNLAQIRARVAAAAVRAGRPPEGVTVVAVSKTFDTDHVRAAHAAGVRHFGENWVQEAADKLPRLSDLDPRPVWHFIGHLQTNKARSAMELFDVVESVDSLHLAEALARRAGDRRLPVLLEVNAGGEPTKFGFEPETVAAACEQVRALPQLDLRGLMTVAPAVDDPERVRPVFRRLRELRDSLGLSDLSMGMSEDFEVAVEEGSTMVRIGRAIFGPRAPATRGGQ